MGSYDRYPYKDSVIQGAYYPVIQYNPESHSGRITNNIWKKWEPQNDYHLMGGMPQPYKRPLAPSFASTYGGGKNKKYVGKAGKFPKDYLEYKGPIATVYHKHSWKTGQQKGYKAPPEHNPSAIKRGGKKTVKKSSGYFWK